MTPVSLTASLTLVPDETLLPNEMHVHPSIASAVRQAFLEADLLRSVHLDTRVRAVIHPFSSVGDEDDAA